jgi:hypothetical protein
MFVAYIHSWWFSCEIILFWVDDALWEWSVFVMWNITLASVLALIRACFSVFFVLISYCPAKDYISSLPPKVDTNHNLSLCLSFWIYHREPVWPWRSRQNVPQKRWQYSTFLRCVTAKKKKDQLQQNCTLFRKFLLWNETLNILKITSKNVGIQLTTTVTRFMGQAVVIRPARWFVWLCLSDTFTQR